MPGDSIEAAVTLALSRTLAVDEARPTASIKSATEPWDMALAHAPAPLGPCSPACEITPAADTHTVGGASPPR